AVAQGPNVGHAGAQLVVDLDVATRIRNDTGMFAAKIVGVWSPAYRQQQMRAVDLRPRPRSFNRHRNASTLLFHADSLAVDADVDVFRLENIGYGTRDILILARDEARRGLDHCYVASEAAVELGKFEADIAAAEHDQVRGQKIDVHHRAVGQVGNFVEPRDRWNYGAPTDIDEDLIGPEHLIGDLDLLRSDKPGVGLVDCAPLQPLQGSLDGGARRYGDGILARLHRLHVDGRCPAESHAKFGGTTCEMRRIAACDQRLGWSAASIDAGTAEKFALDDRDFP